MTADIFLTSRFGPARSVDLARVAERAGFGGVWLAEHHFIRYGQCPSATVLAAHLLAATSRIRIGTAACVFSARNPIALGEEAAMLRDLGGDRFQLGVARGGPWAENDLLGGGMDRYQNGFEEWLDSLLAFTSSQGPAPIVPPLDGPLPIHVAATSLSTVELAARRGLPLLLGVENDNESARRMIDHWAKVAGFESTDHARIVFARSKSDDLETWLRGIGDPARDLTKHVAQLRRQEVPDCGRVIYMVEAAGSVEATADLIEALANVC